MLVDFFFDPACPWCWITSRWLTEVAPQRALELRFRPFSLLEKNRADLREEFREALTWSHGLLRLATAVEERHGRGSVADLYTAAGARIHHDGERGFATAPLLAELRLDADLAAAVDDESRDAIIRAAMDEGLALAGGDVGVPLIAFEGRVAYFGPIMSPAPTGDAALRLWDGLSTLATAPGFFELKKTREVGPILGERPRVAAAEEVELPGRSRRRVRARRG